MKQVNNYLIITFDGLGDGVIYYPIFKELLRSNPHSIFFCTNNKFLSNNNGIIKNKRFHIIDECFRKFPKEKWQQIYDFILKNNVTKIFNLRFIGLKYEKDYYSFKKWIKRKNKQLHFYDDQVLKKQDILNKNVRYIIKKIVFGSSSVKIANRHFPLRFKRDKNTRSILINPHTRGTFKLWENKKWVDLINNLSRYYKVKFYSGFSKEEIIESKKILSKLSLRARKLVTVISNEDLITENNLKDVFLLISVDSGVIHICDSLDWINIIGIYLTTSPLMWGGVSPRFSFLSSKHMLKCKNYYPYFGMCMNNKKKCQEIYGKKDDVEIQDVIDKVNKIYEKKN